MIPQLNSKKRDFLWIKHNIQNHKPYSKSDEHYLSKKYITISSLKTDINWGKKNKKLEKMIKIYSE